MSVKENLSYRQLQAQATRERVAGAARRLFAERGYVGTTVAAIGKAAGIAEPTVYKAFGNKKAILDEIRRIWIRDSEVRPLLAEAMAESDVRRRVDLAATWHRQQLELISRHAVSADFSGLAAEVEADERSVKVTVSGGEGQVTPGHRVVTRYGITGMDCGAEAVVELAAPANILDLEIAHFGHPPAIRVLDGEGRTIADLHPDPRPRQVERLRAVGSSIRRAVIDARRGLALLVAASAPPVGPFLKKKA